ncbi:MAG: hypothetical protein ACP5LX_06620 [Nitrososphaeria archaeon]|jgi:hypothetical protein|nr:hypothetical protein [TACK group archaeon]
MNPENRFGWVKEVAVETDVSRVNRMLAQGYELLAVKGCTSQNLYVVFVLVKGAKGSRKEIWKKNPDGSEWAYAKEADQELLNRAKSPFVRDGYIYWVAKNGKSIHRKPVYQR